MLRRVVALIVALAGSLVIIFATASIASADCVADPVTGEVHCEEEEGGNNGGGNGSTGGSSTCKYDGKEIPCTGPGGSVWSSKYACWIGERGPDDMVPPDGQTKEDGWWHVCYFPPPGSSWEYMWIETGEVGIEPRISHDRQQVPGAARRGVGLHQRPRETALGGLVEVTGGGALPRRAGLPDLHRHRPHGQGDERGVRGGQHVHHQSAVPTDLRAHRVPPIGRQRGDPRQAGATGQAVRGDPVGEPDEAEQRRDDRQGAVGPPKVLAGQRGGVQGGEQHTGVHAASRGSGRCGQFPVVHDEVELGRPESEGLDGPRRVGPAEVLQRVDQTLPQRRQLRPGQRRQIQRTAPGRRTFRLRGGQQDQHVDIVAGQVGVAACASGPRTRANESRPPAMDAPTV